MRRLPIVLFFLCAPAPALAAEPIEGNWVTPRGQTISISACDARFCLYRGNGEALGSVTGAATRYEGQVTNPDNGKTNAVEIELDADTLTVSGCIGPICASRVWTRATP